MNASEVAAKLAHVYRARSGDWDALGALYHPDARVVTVTGGPQPLSVDALIAELKRASEDTWYSVKTTKAVVVDEQAVIFVGRMRRSVPGGGFEDAGHVWMFTVRDDLIYRQRVYGTAEEASAAYRELGVGLGIDGPLPSVATDQRPQAEPVEPLKQWKPASGKA
jgi:ketosteroid isomerase-like protein